MNDPKEQFSLIYDQYIEKIYRFVYLKVSSEEIAQDLTSKVFLKGWEAYQKGSFGLIGEEQKIKNPGAFLYQIARNTVVDHYREAGRTNIVPIDHVAQIVESNKGPYETVVLNSEIDKIKSAIGKLKKDHQDVLIWYYLEDMSAETIAQLLDKPAGTVRVMIHRGLEALKEQLTIDS